MMTEQTALFLAGLSHKYSLIVLALPVGFGAATYYAAELKRRASAGTNALARRAGVVTLAVSGAAFAVSMAAFVVAFFHVGCASLVAHSQQCMSHMKQISMGLSLYTEDYDEHLPAAQQWSEAIMSCVTARVHLHAEAGEDLFQCPAAGTPEGYGMNAALGGLDMARIETPATTVLLFDADAPIRSFAGGAGDVARGRHSGMPNVAFADGHAKGANRSVQGTLDWWPKGNGK